MDEQVKANELYKEEVSATLDNLERENSWKIVEGKMNLISVLCDNYTRQLHSLANKLKTRSLKIINVSELYNNSEAIDLICEAIEKHEALMRHQRDALNERMLQLERDHKELSARLEEIKNDKGHMSALQKDYSNVLFKLVDESKSIKSELARHDADDELVAAVRVVVCNIRKLNQEYESAFQKAYEMTK